MGEQVLAERESVLGRREQVVTRVAEVRSAAVEVLAGRDPVDGTARFQRWHGRVALSVHGGAGRPRRPVGDREGGAGPVAMELPREAGDRPGGSANEQTDVGAEG